MHSMAKISSGQCYIISVVDLVYIFLCTLSKLLKQSGLYGAFPYVNNGPPDALANSRLIENRLFGNLKFFS